MLKPNHLLSVEYQNSKLLLLPQKIGLMGQLILLGIFHDFTDINKIIETRD